MDAKRLVEEAESGLADTFKAIDAIAIHNQARVLSAFRKWKVSPTLFSAKTGYGIDDPGRETIDRLFADSFEAEAAAVRMQFVSGTHALACALFGNLSPGDTLTSITGLPYDTMQYVIGLRDAEEGTLSRLGTEYLETDVIPYLSDAAELRRQLEPYLSPKTRIVYIQKSRGYSSKRRSLRDFEVKCLCRMVKTINPACIVLVDNCYGEFVELEEPCAYGADLVAGSLIKNPGGGLAITGGYLAGRTRYVNAALNRLTAPGIGGHLGLTFDQNRLILQGLFLSPQVVSIAVKGAHLFARVFHQLGFEVFPPPAEPRGDIIQSVKFNEPSKLKGFLRALQSLSPVDSHVLPEPAEMPGYADQVLMAGGTFVEGSTIELSADGPMRPPYTAFIQGGLSYPHIKLALTGVLELGRSEDYRFMPD